MLSLMKVTTKVSSGTRSFMINFKKLKEEKMNVIKNFRLGEVLILSFFLPVF